MSGRAKLVVVLGAGVVLMVGLAVAALLLGEKQSVTPPETPIYTATYTTMPGKKISLGEWQHKLLIINFWATWCAPCREEMPMLSKLQVEYAGKNVQFVGIAADSSSKVANFSMSTPVSYPLLPDEVGAIEFSKRLGNRLGLLPHTVVVAPGGRMVAGRLGIVPEDWLRDVIAKNAIKIN